MQWKRILMVWFAIVLAETVHGILRNLYLTPVIGDLPARQIGIASGSFLIFLIAWFGIGWIGARTPREQIFVGAVWVILMGGFEFALGTALGYPLSRILSDYDMSEGGFMGLGMAFLLFAPMLAAKMRRRLRRSPFRETS